jgi:hypothetical protein
MIKAGGASRKPGGNQMARGLHRKQGSGDDNLWDHNPQPIFVEVKNPAKRLLFILNGSKEGTMAPSSQLPHHIDVNGENIALKNLHARQIVMIDEALSSLDEYGEVRLIVEKKRLRFIVTQKSYDALKWSPGSMLEDRV